MAAYPYYSPPPPSPPLPSSPLGVPYNPVITPPLPHPSQSPCSCECRPPIYNVPAPSQHLPASPTPPPKSPSYGTQPPPPPTGSPPTPSKGPVGPPKPPSYGTPPPTPVPVSVPSYPPFHGLPPVYDSPPPFNSVPPSSNFVAPPRPPGGSHTNVIVACATLGGAFFLAFLLVGLICLAKKKKKPIYVPEAPACVEEHEVIQETITTGPCGEQTVAISIEDDVRIHQDVAVASGAGSSYASPAECEPAQSSIPTHGQSHYN